MPALSATDVIRLLDLKPHPEGGHFCESFRDARAVESTRAAGRALIARGRPAVAALGPGPGLASAATIAESLARKAA